MYRKGFSDYVGLHTRASNADAETRFFLVLRPMESASVKTLLMQGDIYDMTGDMLVELGIQVSDEVENWPQVNTFARVGSTSVSQMTGDGFFATPDFDSVSALLSKAWFRAGFIVRNNSSQMPKIELCWASMRIGARAC